MKTVSIAFPHQLFYDLTLWQGLDKVYVIEEFLFFKQYRFHKQKIVFHRSSMRCFADFLKQEGIEVEYIDSLNPRSDIRTFFASVASELCVWKLLDPVDDWLRRRIVSAATQHPLNLSWLDSPNFLNSNGANSEYQSSRKSYFQTDYYQYFRKKHGVLMTVDQKPLGGKYSFDAENRKTYKGEVSVPEVVFPMNASYVEEARTYTETNFSNNPGHLYWDFNQYYPINRSEALIWLHNFLDERLIHFGDYEDAIVTDRGKEFMFHSVLSPLLNAGLISPKEVLNKTLELANQRDIPLNSLEGFVRQVMGWREFIRHAYQAIGSKQRTTNYWGFNRKIPASFYNGNTGIVPVDFAIKKVLTYAYNHHIERLMILGNFMLLCEFDPDEVYRWFMEMYVDAYDWVMVPNVYGMICFADGGMMTSKPYISGSNYLIKMGGYAKSNDPNGWQAIWDGLFWRFMVKQRAFFSSNPRLGMLLRTWDKMSVEKQQNHLSVAEQFLQSLNA